MAIIKCKMCGGELELTEGSNVCECEYCGTRQTVPTADNEKKMTLFGRANRLRFACEFDKAAGIYESIAAEFPEEAEAYWGLVLCKYGIEYVDDPATAKKVPTCHRSSFDSVMRDSDFEQACENADAAARRVYREEAKAIEELRKGIIEVSGKEEPYDIFICYKETDENGQRTLDSVLAQDVYDALTEKGYRVFFSRISLEDKLGVEYEPYIFAALHSAKIMLAFGTDYEYFNAVWVKNEWSRYLQLMAQDKGKHLIPCYKNIDAYDMPEAFARLQAQDLGKVGAVQDLLRGIEKLLGNKKQGTKQETAGNKAEAPGVRSLLERGNMFLEDCQWESASEYFDRVLDIDPKCSAAYLGKVCACEHVTNKEKLRRQEGLRDQAAYLRGNKDFEKALRFAENDQKEWMEKLMEDWDRSLREHQEATYQQARAEMEKATVPAAYERAAAAFSQILSYRDAAELADACKNTAAALIKEKEAIKERETQLARERAERETRRLAEEERRLKEEVERQARLALEKIERRAEETARRTREEAKQRAEEAKQKAREEQQSQWRSAGLCQHCGGSFKGMFTKKCESCGKTKDY